MKEHRSEGLIVPPRRVAMNLKAKDSFRAIRELCELLEHDPEVSNIRALRSALIKREKVESTAVGGGVAVPHAHSEGVRSLIVCLGISKEGIEFYSTDGGPVHIVAMVCAPDRNFEDYLGCIRRLTKILGRKDIREALLKARDPEEVTEVLKLRNEGRCTV